MMKAMAAALGDGPSVALFAETERSARSHLRSNWLDAGGRLDADFRDLQTANLFALKLGILDAAAEAEACRTLRQNIVSHGRCLRTGFLGTSILMDTLTDHGMVDLAYDLLLQREFPSWLYSVDQGATTVWERWNSYTKEKGFGPVDMNSFNHYAYGAVLAWIYKTVAGIAADPKSPGFRNIVMAPKPDRRLGHVTAEYKSAAGLIRSAWRYEGAKWIWDFTIPEGATATVVLPGEQPRPYTAGSYRIKR